MDFSCSETELKQFDQLFSALVSSFNILETNQRVSIFNGLPIQDKIKKFMAEDKKDSRSVSEYKSNFRSWLFKFDKTLEDDIYSVSTFLNPKIRSSLKKF